MTDKKENILNAARELFAKEGFRTTSTSKVAKHAGVSEGLIFRHFTNKNGLLEAIIEEGESRAKVLFADIVMESDPKELLRKMFSIGDKMNQNEADRNFWKLQYKIKWELEIYAEHKMEPLERALTGALEQLGYEDPGMEAKVLMLTLDGMATRMYLQADFNMEPILTFLMAKYKL